MLVNNVGVPKRRRTTTMTADDVESVMAMNYFSPVRLTLAVLPRMVERGRGDIVNVSSMGAHLVAFGVGAYAASKAALELFTESLYVELPGTGVHAHLVVPGTTATEFSTPKEGNDPPLPPGPGAATADEVAAAIVACVDSDHFVSYATARTPTPRRRRPPTRTRSSPRCANASRDCAGRRSSISRCSERSPIWSTPMCRRLKRHSPSTFSNSSW